MMVWMGGTPTPRLRLVDASVEASPIVAANADGEQGSFAEAFQRHYAFVHRMLRTHGVDAALLDDAAQDVFIVVHRRWHDYDGRRAFRNWLLGIVRRVASGYRRAGRRLRARLERLPVPADVIDLEQRYEQRQQLAMVESFIQQLGQRHREVFVLAELEGLTAPEIAEIVGVGLNTVYSRLRVARERFARWQRRHAARGGGDDIAR